MASAQEAPSARVLLVAERQAVLSSTMAGRITAFPFRPGQSFAKGDVLVRFDCALKEAALREAQARLHGAGSKLTNARKLAELKSKGVLEVSLLEAERAMAASQVEMAKILVRHCAIAAPFSGKVVETMAHLHESVAEGAPLLAILDHTSIRLELVAPSSWLRWLKVGDTFDITIDETGDVVQGRLDEINPRIDSVSQTIKLYGVVQTADVPLTPGMSGTAVFHGAGARE